MKKILFLMALFMSLVTGVANAQDANAIQEEKADYNKAWFVGVDLGGATKATHNAWLKNINPTFGAHIGKWLSPSFGLELDGNLYFNRKNFDTWNSRWAQAQGVSQAQAQDYGDGLVKAFTIGLNLDFNLSNIFGGVQEEPRDWEFIGKLGGFWGHDMGDNFQSRIENNLQTPLALNIARNFGEKKQYQVYVEPSVIWDWYNDRGRGTFFWPTGIKNFSFEHVHFHSDRLAAQVKVGFNYRWASKKPVETDEPIEPVIVPTPVPTTPVAPTVTEPTNVVEPLYETFYYEIRLSDPLATDKLDKIAAWCKKYSDKIITVDGYADRETGNPTLNIGYAKARATKVAQELIKRGVPEAQMIVNSHGDTIQPFAENDKNRCVIVVGK